MSSYWPLHRVKSRAAQGILVQQGAVLTHQHFSLLITRSPWCLFGKRNPREERRAFFLTEQPKSTLGRPHTERGWWSEIKSCGPELQEMKSRGDVRCCLPCSMARGPASTWLLSVTPPPVRCRCTLPLVEQVGRPGAGCSKGLPERHCRESLGVAVYVFVLFEVVINPLPGSGAHLHSVQRSDQGACLYGKETWKANCPRSSDSSSGWIHASHGLLQARTAFAGLFGLFLLRLWIFQNCRQPAEYMAGSMLFFGLWETAWENIS